MTKMTKDDKLNKLYNEKYNIARFISISPNMKIKYAHITENYNHNNNIKQTITDLINHSNSKSVNIRSFSLDKEKGNPVIFNKKVEDIDKIISIIENNCKENKFSIINENIDINDGGISGIIMGNIIEFAPNDTPKCVDKPDVCHMPKEMGFYILKKVYGFKPNIPNDKNLRIEFSIHPNREGVFNKHTIIWEYEEIKNTEYNEKITYPNKFSRFIGDKVFGLLVADYLKNPVPKTTVIARNIPPFTFGSETNLHEKWIRTAPIVKQSGQFYSGNRWVDPFELMIEEEKKGENKINIASIISQNAVDAKYSGAMLIIENLTQIEGVKGNGDEFMLRLKKAENLPNELVELLTDLANDMQRKSNILGNISIEWVYDGEIIWIVQMNQIKSKINQSVIVEGKPDYYEKFYKKDGLDNLRKLVRKLETTNIGIELIGDVGVCSHFGDLLRIANIPSFLTKEG